MTIMEKKNLTYTTVKIKNIKKKNCGQAPVAKKKDGQMGLHETKKLLHNKRNGL
jgi:hypothetical protein